MDPARHLTQKETEMSTIEDLPDDALSVILMMVLLSHGNDEETKWSSDTGLNIKPVRWLANASNELKWRILGYYGHHDTSHPLFVVRLLMFRIEMRVSIATDRYFFNKTTDMMYGLIDGTEFGDWFGTLAVKPVGRRPARPSGLGEYMALVDPMPHSGRCGGLCFVSNFCRDDLQIGLVGLLRHPAVVWPLSGHRSVRES